MTVSDIVGHGALEEGRRLKEHAHPAPQEEDIHGGDVAPVDKNTAGRRLPQPVQATQQGRFAAAAGADHRGDSTGGDLE